MTKYQLYFLQDSQLIGQQGIDAADDEDAVRIAKRSGRGQVIEIWNGHARVRVVAPIASRRRA